MTKGPVRQVMLAIKRLLDRFRHVFDIYSLLIWIWPGSKTTILRLLGTLVTDDATVQGSIRVWEPAWFQINGGSHIDGIAIKRNAVCLVDNNASVTDADVTEDTLFLKDRVLVGEPLPGSYVTISIDLEGAVALAHAGRQDFERLRPLWMQEKTSAQRLRDLFVKHHIPVTWAVCGHLFLDSCDGRHPFDEHNWNGPWFTHDPATDYQRNPDWYMPDFIQELIDEPLFEVGYHTFGHFRYPQTSTNTIRTDMALADEIRKSWDIPLESFVYPYNETAAIDLVVQHGFKNLRGYIGQYYAAKTIQFNDFRYFVTSQFLGPETVAGCSARINEIAGQHFNYFTHPFDWLSDSDFEYFERFLTALSKSRERDHIRISTFADAV